MLRVEFERHHGIIRCMIHGFLSMEQVALIINQTKIAKEECKRLYGDMKMLVVTDGQVQGAQAMRLVANQREASLGPYDRRAFVLPTSLQKMQVGRLFHLPNEKIFISETAAITWLLADRAYRPSHAAAYATG